MDRLHDPANIQPPLLPSEPLEPDPVIEAYKVDVDRTLFRENLKLTPTQRLEKLMAHLAFIDELHAVGERMRRQQRKAG